MLATILTLIGTLVPTILQNRGIIGASTTNLITLLAQQAEALFANLKSSTSPTQSALAALATIQGVINVLKATTNLPADTLTQINGLEADVAAALTAYAKGGQGFDPAVYGPIAEV